MLLNIRLWLLTSHHGKASFLRLFQSREESPMVESRVPTTDPYWSVDPSVYVVGELRKGDRIYFAVDRNKVDNAYDSTQMAWTVTLGEKKP